MNILLLSHKFYPFTGGIEVMSEELACYLNSKGHEIHVLTWTDDTGVDRKFPYKIIRNPKVFSILQEHCWADIIFENNLNIRLSWPQFFLHKPHLIVLHGQIRRIDGTIGIQDRLKFKWLTLATKVLAVSNSLKDQTYNKADVILNFYRNNQFRMLENKRDANSFVFLGRLVSVKGVDIAIKTIVNLLQNRQEFADVKLTIIGNGPMLMELKDLVAELKLTDRISFKGILTGESLVQELNMHRYMLVPSTQEPFGIVALEGMACGCLPIVSNVDGLPEAIGNAGLVVKDCSVENLCNAIIYLKENPKFENELRINSKEHLKRHTKECVCQKYAKIIETIIEK